MSIPKILYEDTALIVVEKPAGLASLAAKPGAKDPNTVEGWLQARWPSAQLVHRLDNETSGLMVAAKNEAVWEKLRALWKTDAVVKKYTALVEGRTPPSGKIFKPIAHHPRKKKKMVMDGKKARPAETFFKTLRPLDLSGQPYSLLEVKITTGVRHQIRVHLASIGHPVAGDKIYSKNTGHFQRHCLHLSFLQFPHPTTGKIKTYRSKISFP